MIRSFTILYAISVVITCGCAMPVNDMNSKDQLEWVIRTDFSSDDTWNSICAMIKKGQQRDTGGKSFEFVKYVSDHAHERQPIHALVRSLPDNYPGMFCFLVDQESIENTEHPVLVVGFYPSDDKSFDRLPSNTPEGDIATFRALPSQIWPIRANLSNANMDFEDFARSVQADGVFRGFRR